MIHTLEADSIRLEFGNKIVLSSIYIKLETKKIAGLLGRNGQGKSCLMKIIYGSLKIEKSVRFDNVTLYDPFKRPDLILYLPQFNFIPGGFSLKRIFKDFELDYSTFLKWFPEFTTRYGSMIDSFSGGEQRLIELYVIIKAKSKFAMLDEPFTHLSPLQIEKIKELLLEEKENKGLLITDHMYNHIIDLSNDLYVLTNGKSYLTKDLDEIEILGYSKK